MIAVPSGPPEGVSSRPVPPPPLRIWLPLLLTILAAGCGLHGGRLTLVEENDVFNLADSNNPDRDYTQGFAAALTLADEDTPGWARDAAGAVPLFARNGRVHLGLLAGQEIYTPENRNSVAALPDDRPYAGWLYAGAALQVPVFDEDPILRRDRVDQLELDLGVLGPSAHGEKFQNFWHKVFDISDAKGWRHQVGGTMGAMATWETRWRVAAADLGGNIGWDLLPRARVRLGNVRTDGTVGAMTRLGWRLPRDFGPMAVDAHGLVSGAAPDGAFFALHLAFEVRGVAYDRFLSGGGGSPSVTPIRSPRRFSIGLSHGWGPFTFIYEQNFVSPEFKEDRRNHRYTTMMLVLDRYF